MDSNEFITTEEVVAEAVEYLGDTNFTKGVGKSFYELIVHRAIEELALHTFFQKVTQDIYNWNCGCGDSCCGGDGTGIISMPKNMFNVRELYLFNSSCDNKRCGTENTCNCSGCVVDSIEGDCCSSKTCWTNYVEAHWARTFNKFGSSGIKTKTINSFSRDPVNDRTAFSYQHFYRSNLIYFGIQNGQICMSDSALCYKNMRIVANGFGTDNCELPIIPRPLRQVCVDLLKLKGCMKLMLTYPEYKQMYPIYQLDLYGNNSVQNPGSWLRAERYVKSLNSKQRNDIQIYYGNIDIK